MGDSNTLQIKEQLYTLQVQMRDNIQKCEERGANIEDLDRQSEELGEKLMFLEKMLKELNIKCGIKM